MFHLQYYQEIQTANLRIPNIFVLYWLILLLALRSHKCGQSLPCFLVMGIFFLGVYCMIGTIAYHAGKYCVKAFIPPAKYFIYATAIVAFLSMGSNTNSRTLANYFFFTSFIGGGFLIAIWGNKNENVDIIFTKTVSIVSKVFGWFFFILWLSLMGYLVYDWIN